MVLQGHVTNQNHYISTKKVPMTNKFGRMIISVEGLLPIKSHDPFIIWSCEIARQTKIIIPPIVVSMAIKLKSVVSYPNWLLPMKLLNPLVKCFCYITWKLKPLYLRYYSAYDYQIWEWWLTLRSSYCYNHLTL